MLRRAARFVTAGAGIVVVAAICLSLQNNLAPVVFGAGTNPPTLLMLRFMAIITVMAVWCRASGQSMRLARAHRMPGYLSGLLFAVASAFVLTAFARIPVSLAILIIYSQPILTFLTESALDRRAPRPLVLACLVGAFAGLALALKVRFDTLDPVGIACAAAGACCMTLALVTNARLVKGGRSAALSLHMAIAGLVFAAGFTFISGRFALAQQSAADWAVLAVAIALFGTGFFTLFMGVRRIGASSAAQLMNLEPVLTVGLAVAAFGESMTGVQIAGAALVIVCVALTQWIRVAQGRRAAQPATVPPTPPETGQLPR